MDTPSPVDVAVSTALAKDRNANDIESLYERLKDGHGGGKRFGGGAGCVHALRRDWIR